MSMTLVNTTLHMPSVETASMNTSAPRVCTLVLFISFSKSGGVSGPNYSGRRSTSRDTDEGELRITSIAVRVHCQCHSSRY